LSKKRKYGPRTPRYATGIRLQELRASGNRSRWAKEWIDRVSAMQFGARMGLAKSYAQSGQVTSLVREGGVVTAEVTGVRPDPYVVKLDFRQAKGAAKKRIEARLAAEPMLVARMLAGELPMEVEEILRDEGFSPYPGGAVSEKGRHYDVEISCSCPDWANPCKHATAALLVLGERLAARPTEYLALRGIDVEPGPSGAGTGAGEGEKSVSAVQGEVLPRLGPIPEWRGEKRVLPELEKLYKAAMLRAAAERW